MDVINPGITAGIGTSNQINPLDMVGKFAYTQNALNQNALFQQTFRARQALGPLAQQSIDPKTGQMDWDKLVTLAAVHPDTAFIAQDIANNAAQKKLIDAETTNQRLTATKSRMDIMAGIWSAAAKDPAVKDVSDLSPYISQAMSLGGIEKKQDAISFMADPKIQGLKGPEFRQMLTNHALAMQHGSSALTAMNSAFGPMGYDAAGNVINGWTNAPRATATPVFGGTGAGAALSAGPTAGAAALTGAPPGFKVGAPGPRMEWINKTYYPQLQDAANASQSLLNILGEGKQLLADATTGRAAPTRLEIARWLTSAGISDDVARKVAGGDPYNSQALSKLILYIGTQGMRQANQGNAAVRSVQEWNKFMEANPNLANDKLAITKMWDFMSYQASLVRSEQNEFNRWSEMGKDVTQFPAKWNDFVDDSTQSYFKSRAKLYGQGGQQRAQ